MSAIGTSITAKILVLLVISLSGIMAINSAASSYLQNSEIRGGVVQALLLIIFSTVVLYLGISRILITRIKRLVSSIDACSSGNPTSRTSAASLDELGLLSAEFNRMEAGIKEYSVRLHEEIAEVKRLKASLDCLMLRSERMAMANGLTAGFAHEINNPLGAILQHAQNIERRISPDLPANLEAGREVGVGLEKLCEYLDKRGVPGFVTQIREAGTRVAKIVASMSRISRASEVCRETAVLAAVINQALELASIDYDLKKRYDFSRIEIVREDDPALPRVAMIVSDMELVLVSMIRNAAQAMGEGSTLRKRRITLRTRRDGGDAVIEIEDNGPGMDESVRRLVFEPFYTTREGVGTGLGLSVSRSIVTSGHQGSIAVRSRPGEGACFIVRLPLDGGET